MIDLNSVVPSAHPDRKKYAVNQGYVVFIACPLSEILQILSISLFEKEWIYQALSDFSLQNQKSDSLKQLMLNI